MHTADYAVARCLSVCHTPVLSVNGYTYPQSFFAYQVVLIDSEKSIYAQHTRLTDGQTKK